MGPYILEKCPKPQEFLDSKCVDTDVLCTEADPVAVLQDCSQTCTGECFANLDSQYCPDLSNPLHVKKQILEAYRFWLLFWVGISSIIWQLDWGFEDSDFDTYREMMIKSWRSLNVFQDKDCMPCFLPGKATHSEVILCWHQCSSSHGEPTNGGLKLTGTVSLSSDNKTFIPFP